MLATCLKAPAATPLGTGFLCVADTVETKTEAGIELSPSVAEAVRKDTKAYTVVKLGPGLSINELQVGSRVLFNFTPTSKLVIGGIEYFLGEPESVAAVLDEPLVEVE